MSLFGCISNCRFFLNRNCRERHCEERSNPLSKLTDCHAIARNDVMRQFEMHPIISFFLGFMNYLLNFQFLL